MLDHTSEEKQGWVQVGGMREVAIFNECRKSCLLCKDIYEIAEKTLQRHLNVTIMSAPAKSKQTSQE
jgi:hypothetical protein